MKAFHGRAEIKEKYIQRMKAHIAADELVQGKEYWTDGKGCAVGCTLHSRHHSRYRTELGIPTILALIEDRIFENLSVIDARSWPLKFLEAPKAGADLSLVWPKFAVWMLTDHKDGVLHLCEGSEYKATIRAVAALWEQVIKGESVSDQEFFSAAGSVSIHSDVAYFAARATTDVCSVWNAMDNASYRSPLFWKRSSEKLLELMSAA